MRSVSISLASVAIVLAVVSVIVWTNSASSKTSATNTPVVVKVTIRPNLLITFSPKAFHRGTVVLRVTNRNDRAHSFTINGVTTKTINPERTLLVTVTFKRAAIYTAALPDCGYLSMCPERPDQGAVGSVKVT